MGKFKLAGKKKNKSPRPGGAIPCIALIVIGIVLVSLLFYAILKSG
jgi:hypothetical protein